MTASGDIRVSRTIDVTGRNFDNSRARMAGGNGREQLLANPGRGRRSSHDSSPRWGGSANLSQASTADAEWTMFQIWPSAHVIQGRQPLIFDNVPFRYDTKWWPDNLTFPLVIQRRARGSFVQASRMFVERGVITDSA